MNILFLTPYLPSFGLNAGAGKMFECIRRLSERCRIELISFISIEDKERISHIKDFCSNIHAIDIKDYSCFPYRCHQITNLINRILSEGDIDILQCEYSFMSRYLPEQHSVPYVLTKHQIDSLSFLRRLKIERGILNKSILFLRAIKKKHEEKIWLDRFNKIIVFSDYDRDVLVRLYKTNSIEIIPLGVDTDYFSACLDEEETNDLVFVGNFSHRPNVDAVIYFCHEIMPLLKRDFPKVTMVVVGRNPSREIMDLQRDPNVRIAGYVKDIRPYIAKSRIFIMPIRFGSGIRGKLLEAWAMEKPVVSTSIGCEGVQAVDDKNILLADNSENFSFNIKRLLNDKKLRERLGRAGRDTVMQNYQWSDLIKKIERVYESLL